MVRADVEGGGGLVEDQDARPSQERAGDRDALALAGGELLAAFADDGVEAGGELADDAVDAGRRAGTAHVVVARELGTPMVVGASGASERIVTGSLVNVDGLTGVISVTEMPGDRLLPRSA